MSAFKVYTFECNLCIVDDLVPMDPDSCILDNFISELFLTNREKASRTIPSIMLTVGNLDIDLVSLAASVIEASHVEMLAQNESIVSVDETLGLCCVTLASEYMLHHMKILRNALCRFLGHIIQKVGAVKSPAPNLFSG